MNGDGPGAPRYRADALAAEGGIGVQLLRSSQSKGLPPPPRHEGRVAWYGPHHRERLLHIRHLKERGYSLRMVAQALHDGGDGAAPLIDEHEVLRLGEVAERSGVPVEVLRALEASGLLRPHHLADGDRYSDADVRFARHQLETSDELGRDVVGAWSQLVGTRLRRGRREAPQQAAKVAASLRALAAIVGQLVAYRVERAVLDAAQAEIEAEGTDDERAAFARSLTSPHHADG